MSDEAAIFRTTYGRLCRLSAHAIHDGYHPNAVFTAHVGKNAAQDDRLKAINRQAEHLDAAIRIAHKAGLTTAVDLVPIAAQTKAAIEGEWQVTIPLTDQASTPSA